MRTQAHNNSTDVTSESIKWRDAADSWNAVEGRHQAAPSAAVGLDAARHTFTAHRAPSQCQRQTLNAAESETKDGPVRRLAWMLQDTQAPLTTTEVHELPLTPFPSSH